MSDTQAVLLEAGLVVDGSGGPSWPGDVLLQGDRIVATVQTAAPLSAAQRSRLGDALADAADPRSGL